MFGNIRRTITGIIFTFVTLAPQIDEVQAAVTINGGPVSGGFEFVGNGTLDLTGLQFTTAALTGTRINPATATILLGNMPGNFLLVDEYAGVDAPAEFGTGNFSFGNDGSGQRFGLDVGQSRGAAIFLPAGFSSGDSINSTLLFAGGTLDTLGLKVGTYKWTWPSDSVTLNIVPVPAALPLLATGLVGLAVARRWRRA